MYEPIGPSHLRFSRWATVSALLLASTCVGCGQKPARDITVQNHGESARPNLIFACDRPTAELDALFTPELIADLQQLKAGVALSTEDLSSGRARIVQKLNAASVPMIAWLALERSQGYYVNARNEPQTAARFEEFDRWTRANNLHWQAVGLDIEPMLSEYSALMDHKGRLLSLMLGRAFDSAGVIRARNQYSALIRTMQARGYYVQTYQLMFLADERRAHSTLLERLFGIVDVRGNEEVLMLYTSFNHEAGAGIIWEYGPESQVIAVGSTAASGDTVADAKFPPLDWSEFSRDVIVARHFAPTVGVYSLEGCVRQGFLPKLKAMDWNQPAVITAQSLSRAAHVRQVVSIALWVGSHFVYLFLVFLLLAAWLVRFIIRRRRFIIRRRRRVDRG